MPDAPRVFVTRALPGGGAPDAPLARLRAAATVDLWEADTPPPAAALRARAAGCDGLLSMLTERIDAPLLDACPRLRAVSNLAVGYDNIDVAACTARGVAVTNTPGVLTDATADMTFALLLAAARRLPEGERAVRTGAWGPWHPTWLLGHAVTGATLGIVGPGRIGAAVARRARGFEMRVLYHGRHEAPGFPGARATLDGLLARSDYVSVHLPLTAETAGICDAAFFAKMQRHAIFVNTARGGVVDQPALARALRDGVIAGAAVDVTAPEPLPPDDPLLSAPHLVIAPHLGSATEETRTRMAQLAVDGLLAALAGRRPQHLVNPQALTAGCREVVG
ncbi:MAG: D-glycerate dehydrogenase [Dehalococcoidia bacterium]|nr:D-glycerate dehydrogenase [Dehalococcoidia bacterium]